MQTSQGRAYILIAAMLWGTTGTAQVLAPPGADPASIGTLRLLVGGVGLLIFALTHGGLHRPYTWSFPLTVGTGLSIAAYQFFFFNGVARTGIAVGTIIAIGSSPVIAGVLSWWLRGERPSGRWLVSTALATLGAVLLTIPQGNHQVDMLGIAFALGAGVTYTLYIMGSKRLLEDHPPAAVMAVIFSIGAVAMLPLLKLDWHWFIQPRAVLVSLHLGLMTITLAYILFAQGLQTTPAATAVTLSLAEPMTAATLGIVVFNETLTMGIVVGIMLLLAGLILLSLPPAWFRRRKATYEH